MVSWGLFPQADQHAGAAIALDGVAVDRARGGDPAAHRLHEALGDREAEAHALAAVVMWRASPTASDKGVVIALFAVNAGLNVLWSLFFFKLKRPDWALIEVVFLWLSIVALIIAFYPHSPLAAALLVPYLIWVSIASVLNRAMVRLNGPFDGRAARGGIVKGQS